MDDDELKATRWLNGADRPIAKTDITYCLNNDCKDKCFRHHSNYKFDSKKLYSYTKECIKED